MSRLLSRWKIEHFQQKCETVLRGKCVGSKGQKKRQIASLTIADNKKFKRREHSPRRLNWNGC
jgi:hypothetical protein